MLKYKNNVLPGNLLLTTGTPKLSPKISEIGIKNYAELNFLDWGYYFFRLSK